MMSESWYLAASTAASGVASEVLAPCVFDTFEGGFLRVLPCFARAAALSQGLEG